MILEMALVRWAMEQAGGTKGRQVLNLSPTSLNSIIRSVVWLPVRVRTGLARKIIAVVTKKAKDRSRKRLAENRVSADLIRYTRNHEERYAYSFDYYFR